MKRSHRILMLSLASLVVLAVGVCIPLLAKHGSNPGPADPPIKFKVPTPVPLPAADALKTFKLPPGFRIEVVAAEPLVEDPIAMAFDADGRIWVVEMRGYMHDIDGRGEDQPIGRIRVLTDTDSDGRMDKADTFLDGVTMPRAVLPVRGGALVAEPPELAHWVDTDNDGKGSKKAVVATDYGRRGGQPEHMANGLMPGLDNWIYNAAHSSRYRFRQGKWVAEPSRSFGQWGLAQDDYGRLYSCYNSDLIRAHFLPSHYFGRNPYYQSAAALNVQLTKNQLVWPSHATPGVNRGYQPNELREDGTLQKATAVGGNMIYRGDLFPPEFRGNYFVPEPSGNLIKRLILTESGGKISAEHAYEKMDFLTSTDERFRPVNMTNGPDGAIYIVDLYRGVLQHTAFLTNYLIKNIKERNLESPIHNGRIYRIVPEGATPKPVKLPKEGPALVEFLGHPNGWVRDMAQQRLVEQNKDSTVPALETMTSKGTTPLARLHALWTLDGMNKLDPPVAVKALTDGDAYVRAAAIRILEPQLVPATRELALPDILKLAADNSSQVQLQLALTLSNVPDPKAEEAVATLLTTETAAPDLMRDSVISGLRGRELEFSERLLKTPGWSDETKDRATTLSALAQCVMTERRSSRVKRLLEVVADETEGSWRQVALLTGMQPRGAAAKPPAETTTKPATTKPTATASKTVATNAPAESRPAAGKPTTTKPAATPATAPAELPALPVKLIYLDDAPEALTKLLASKNKSVRVLAERVDRRLAWPNKPGVPPPPKIIPLTAAEQQQFERGKAVYGQTCAACHQPSGLGQDGLAPPLADSEWVLGSERRMIRIVLQGMSGPVSVGGAQYSLEMPPLASMPDEDIAASLTYIRREWEHAGKPVTTESVRKERDATRDRVDPWTAKELLELK